MINKFQSRPRLMHNTQGEIYFGMLNNSIATVLFFIFYCYGVLNMFKMMPGGNISTI